MTLADFDQHIELYLSIHPNKRFSHELFYSQFTIIYTPAMGDFIKVFREWWQQTKHRKQGELQL